MRIRAPWAVVRVALLFALIHGEQAVAGMVLVIVDAVFFGILRYAYGSLWAPVVADGLGNTIGMVAFFLVGPFSAPW
jgi:membrane protease YdiL (CAAX protease family)